MKTIISKPCHIFTFLLAILLFKVESQQFFFKNYSVESGLPFVQVSCMYQDNNGYLWSGGFGGLSRFDGKLFLNYNLKSGLIDHNVNAICEDDKGKIFIGTNKGISVLIGRTFFNYNKVDNVVVSQVNSLCKGYHHSIYIGTNKGLYMFKDEKIKQVKKLAGYKINCLYNPDTTVIFIGTDKGLIVYGHNTFNVLNAANGLAGNKVTCITQFKNYLVIGSSKGMSLYNVSTRKFTNYFIENGLIDENISAVCNQNNRFLWIGSQGGLLRFDGKVFNYYSVDSDNNGNHIKSILNDREDNIWLGTRSGLYRYRDNSFSTFDKINGPGNAFIFQIFRDKKNNLWLCSQNNGIYKYSQGYFKRYSPKDGLKSVVCKAGLEDNLGHLIFSSGTKLMLFKNDQFNSIQLPKEFNGPFENIFQARDNTIWIAGSNGVASLIWKNTSWESKYYNLHDKRSYQTYGLCEGQNGEIYVGTSPAGLYKIKDGVVSNLNKDFNLKEEDFFALRFYKGFLFGASLNGVLVINTKTLENRYINETDGLNSSLVYSIEFAENNASMWIGTNQGVNKLDIKLFLEKNKVNIISYGKLQGFMGVECNSNGIWEDKDGTLWFGTVNGLVKHEPYSIKKNDVKNKTLIQNIRVLNEDTLVKDSLVLPHDYNTISFYYRGVCLTNPDKVLYQKKLEGLSGDKEWSIPSTEDYSKYANLAPGKYTFKVRSSNNEGIWDLSETKFSFRIKSPFYLTWWFLLIAFIVLFSTIYIIFSVRVYNIKKKQRLNYERKVEMSKIELKALRSQMNPHFIFNSLNSIQHYIFNTKSDEAIKYLNKFARLVRIILNNSERPTVTVSDDIEALKLYLELEQMRFEDKFEYEIIIEDSVDTDYDIMPPLLMQPYVENAILHGLNPAPYKGKLTIRMSSENNFLICTIVDNGIGREKASEIRRTMPVKSYRPLGMKITEDRLRILNEINNSKLSVTITDLKNINNQSLGTKVELFVPLTG
ncbi:two-component regulator propeller domain-containing protein [Aurantibacillus circumpalustris]|uniref:two-component regulator propeller domain-containing protein n=1 Tax=Aurantibacillus circumpalustris TaxID=3036359 RepID=UPI00295AECFE|nr:two-component regulator propeller domain-containing protein [Aurantibacillus circumpalustris]